MRAIPSSPRVRRRLAWGSGLAAVLALLATLVVVTMPDRTPELPGSAARGPGYAPAAAPKAQRRRLEELKEPLAVAARFIDTAVARRRVEDSWELVTPELRRGYTRERWARGDIPVVPYPVRYARWELDYSYADEIGLYVALFPKRGSNVGATVFTLDLRRDAARRRWLVSGFAPAQNRTSTRPGAGPSQAFAAAADDRADAVLGARWLLVPLGLLAIALLVPPTVAVVYWLRVRRAERAWARGDVALLDRRELDELVRVVRGDAEQDQRQSERDRDGA